MTLGGAVCHALERLFHRPVAACTPKSWRIGNQGRETLSHLTQVFDDRHPDRRVALEFGSHGLIVTQGRLALFDFLSANHVVTTHGAMLIVPMA